LSLEDDLLPQVAVPIAGRSRGIVVALREVFGERSGRVYGSAPSFESFDRGKCGGKYRTKKCYNERETDFTHGLGLMILLASLEI
jgi:hypothetical protein